jgi:TfoX/Sxy family transcriptional regulator of competence genes
MMGRHPDGRRFAYHRRMAYDEALAERIRELVAGEPGLTEQKMFGGLAFLIGGNMAVAASGQGGMLVRTDPAQTEELTANGDATVAVMRGRPMPGWLRLESAAVSADDALRRWVGLGVAYARSLPEK